MLWPWPERPQAADVRFPHQKIRPRQRTEPSSPVELTGMLRVASWSPYRSASFPSPDPIGYRNNCSPDSACRSSAQMTCPHETTPRVFSILTRFSPVPVKMKFSDSFHRNSFKRTTPPVSEHGNQNVDESRAFARDQIVINCKHPASTATFAARKKHSGGLRSLSVTDDRFSSSSGFAVPWQARCTSRAESSQ